MRPAVLARLGRACDILNNILLPQNLEGQVSPWLINAIRIGLISVYLGIGCFVFSNYQMKEVPCGEASGLASSNAMELGSGQGSGLIDLSSGPYSEAICEELLTLIDALYLSVVTISTVGYGDLSPTGVGMRTFTMVYILGGCLYIFVLLSRLFAGVLLSYRALVLSIIDHFDSAAKEVGTDTNGDGLVDTAHEVSGRSKGISGKGVDLSGDGQVDFIEPPGPAIYWLQELFPAVLLWLIMQLVRAAALTLEHGSGSDTPC